MSLSDTSRKTIGVVTQSVNQQQQQQGRRENGVLLRWPKWSCPEDAQEDLGIRCPAIRMSQSRSPKAPLYVSTSPTDFMAEALVAPTPAHLPASFYQRRRTPPPVHLPPLSIPSAPRSEPTEVESPHVRLPSLQAIAPRPQGEQDVTATQQERARPARRGAPLADILSPQPSTPARSEVGISPSYVVRGSSPQRFVEATSAGRYFYGRQVDSDTSPGDGRFEPSYTSPVEAPPYPRPATALSPTQTSGLETGLQYQASRAAQYFPSESSRPSAARLGSYGIPQQPTSAAGTFSPTVKSNNGYENLSPFPVPKANLTQALAV